MFVYDAIAEALACNIEPFTLDELKNRGSLYVTKQSRQQMETQQADEYKVYIVFNFPHCNLSDDLLCPYVNSFSVTSRHR